MDEPSRESLVTSLRKLYLLLFIFWVTLAVGQVNPAASNGPGCVGNGVPGYCNKAFTALSTDPANTNAQTQVVDAAPAAISTFPICTYLWAGACTDPTRPRYLFHYQTWFCNTGTTCNSHINVGYNENNSTTVDAQLRFMKALGADVFVPDYYGNSPSKLFNRTTVDVAATLLTGNPSAYPKMLLGMDQGAWTNSGQCPKGSGINDAQMQVCLFEQFDYAAVHYLYQTWYETSGGKPLVTLFLDTSGWPSVNWTTVYTALHAHVAAGQHCTTVGLTCTYTTQVLVLGRNSGDIPQAGLDGAAAWSPTQPYNNASPATQFQYDGTSGYFENFYSIARANSTKHVIGLLETGFDDSVPGSFGTGKMIAKQCALLPQLTAAKLIAAGYSAASPIERLQVQTLNDYEEGTEMETGLDNCLGMSASVVSNSLNFTATFSDATYGTLNTVDHFQAWYCLTGVSCTLIPGQSNISPAMSGSVPLANVPPGVWTVKIEAVGKSMVRNQLSNAVSYTVLAPPAPASGLFATVSGLLGTGISARTTAIPLASFRRPTESRTADAD